MSVDSIEKLFIAELKDLYSAERQITKALPKMAAAVDSQELKSALESHLKETRGHVERLEKIGQILGKSLKGKKCMGMEGVLSEGAEVLDETDSGSVRDAGAISAAQRVEHYEMAGYGAVRAYAVLLGHKDVAALLDETLAEEKAANQKLTTISKTVNSEAMQLTA